MRYKVKDPEGKIHIIEGPEGANPDEIVSRAKLLIPSGSKLSAFQRFGKYLPVAGSVAGGIMGGSGGTVLGMGVGGFPGAVGGSALGGAAGEAGRQLIGRMMGEKSPQTMGEAAKDIGIQGGLGAAGEVAGAGLGKAAGAAYKALPKLGQAISGTPTRNIAKAQIRGFPKTYFPKILKGLNRESAGAAKGSAEEVLNKLYLKPTEMADLALRDSGYAKGVVKKSLTKFKMKIPLSVDEAFKTLRSVDVIYRDTPQGMKVAPELAKLRRYADTIVSKVHPEYKAAKQASEAAILRSQLLKPFRVNKSRPDELSGFSGALGAFKPAAYLATAPFSPLAFGVGSSALGSLKHAIPETLRKVIQRSLIQSGVQNISPGTLQK